MVDETIDKVREGQDLVVPTTSAEDALAITVHRLVVLLFLGIGIWVCWTAYGLTLYSSIGPGPGFFPFWTGLLLAMFSAAVLAQSFRAGEARLSERLIAPPKPLARVATIIVCIAGFAAVVEHLGFALTMFGVLLVLLVSNGCRILPTALLVALGGSFGAAFAFQNWLGVYLPPAPRGLLQFMGM